MAFVGRGLDRIAGSLSHLLHVRAARHNTVDDLGPYLGAGVLYVRVTPRS